MGAQNFLIMQLLRLITPEEIGDIATKHNGGKFLSLTELVKERIEKNILRDFSNNEALEELHEQHSKAKILPFKKASNEANAEEIKTEEDSSELSTIEESKSSEISNEKKSTQHVENENMSSFILIEKERLKRSQKSLKQKEIIDLYQKNSNVDVEQIKGSNNNLAQDKEAGVLVNKKQY